jgi:hypothetical protein
MTDDEDRQDAIDSVRDRIYARKLALSIYDGDLQKARRFYRVDHGWHPILDELVTGISKIPTAGFFSAGQKWGGLRVAYVCDDEFRDQVDALNEVACEQASHTCEICGRAGELRKTGWWKVLCDEHQDMRSIKEHLRARFPDLVDADSKILIRGSWLKYPWLFLEQIEALMLEDKLKGTRIRLRDVYERGGQIVLEYDTIPPCDEDGRMSTSDPRVLLKIRHIAEEIALESKLETKE